MDIGKKSERHTYTLGEILGWGLAKIRSWGRAKRRGAFRAVKRSARHHARQLLKKELEAQTLED